MRKLLTFFFAALMSASMFALDPKGEDTWDEGTKTLTVNSNPAYEAYKYKDEIQHVIINNGVTSIGVDAFYYCAGLTSVTIPNSVTSIGAQAFYYCTGLTSVTCVRETPANLGNDVFDHTHANLKIYVPAASVTDYKTAWSAYADKIKAIPPAWVRDGDDWDYATKTLTVNSDLPQDAYRAQTVIEHVIISSGVTSIGSAAFWDCTGLTSVTIPNSVTSIEHHAFVGCTGLTSIEIPSSVTWIGTQAFSSCTSLESVTILAESLEFYGLLTFQATPAALKIYVPAGSVDTYKAGWSTYKDKIVPIIVNPVQIDGLYYNLDADNQTAEVTSMPSGKYTGDIIIPESVKYYSLTYSVTSIGDYAFSGCSGLTSVTCVRETPANLGNDAFNECSNLNAIYVPCGTLDAYQSSWTQYQSYIQYAQPEYTIIGNVNIAGAGTVILPQTICDNSITATPNYGYHFVQWSDGVTENPRTIELTQDTTFTAEFAYDRTGKCGNDLALTWTYDPEGKVLTISGNGAFEQNMQCGAEARGEMTEVIFEDGVTSIGGGAFAMCSSLASIEIPNSVTSIGEGAFSGCSGLTSVTINATTPPTLGGSAFEGTAAALTIYVPEGSVETYKGAWTAYAGKIVAIVFERKQIGDLYYNLKNENKTAEVTSQNSSYPYWSTTITTANIPSSVTYKSVSYSVTSIGDSAFYECTGLTSIEIPNSVTSIGEGAFSGCSGLTSVTIPNSVTSIGEGAFELVPNIVYSGSATGSPWGARSVNGYVDGFLVYSDDTKTNLLACSSQATGTIEIPNSVTSIGQSAFYYCPGLTSITIPNSVISIGSSAFAGCSGLEKVTILAESLESYGSGAFQGTAEGLKIYVPVGSVETYKTAWTAYAEKIKAIPPAWVRDGDDWDYATNTLTVNSDLPYEAYKAQTVIEHVIISSGVTSIGNYAFDHCTGMTSVTIPEGVTSIGNYAFDHCTGMTSVTIPEGVTSIGNYAFRGCSHLTSVTIPNSVTSIREGAFQSCSGLTSIEIPNSVISIGNYAFFSCSGLTSITIPSSVTSIGNFAFSSCTGLTSITIPSSVEYIGGDAFYGCTNITDVYCYPNAEDLTWNEYGKNDFKADGSTRCHVLANQLTAYKSKFNGTVNVTFVGDLPAPTPTAVENVQTNEVQATKFFRDGQILILRDGRTYTLTGQAVK